MAGGGGGEDYTAQAAAAEAKKQAARDALNLQFGVRSTSTAGAPTREQFTRIVGTPADPQAAPTGSAGGGSRWDGAAPADGMATGGVSELFDQGGYDAALAGFNNQGTTADANKAARDALYGKVRGDAFAGGKRRLDESKTTANRDLRFELFAKGLNGGSVDVDQNAKLGRTYDQGLLDLGARADTVRNDLRSSDEQTRLGLLQSIDAGMDQGSALSSALAQMNVNNDRAASNATGTTVGDLFSGAGLVYSDSQARKGRQMGLDSFSKLFSTRPNAAGAGGSGGTISSTGG